MKALRKLLSKIPERSECKADVSGREQKRCDRKHRNIKRKQLLPVWIKARILQPAGKQFW